MPFENKGEIFIIANVGIKSSCNLLLNILALEQKGNHKFSEYKPYEF